MKALIILLLAATITKAQPAQLQTVYLRWNTDSSNMEVLIRPPATATWKLVDSAMCESFRLTSDAAYFFATTYQRNSKDLLAMGRMQDAYRYTFMTDSCYYVYNLYGYMHNVCKYRLRTDWGTKALRNDFIRGYYHHLGRLKIYYYKLEHTRTL